MANPFSGILLGLQAVIDRKVPTILGVRVSTLLVIAVLLVAAIFRLWKLDSIPPGLYLDEGLVGNQASQSMRDFDWRVYYTDIVHGYEGLYPNTASIIIKAFDLTGMEREAWMLRLTSALFGILTVWGVYLLTKEMFWRSDSEPSSSLIPGLPDSALLGLVAAFLLAVSFWHVHLSRIAFSTVVAPFTMTFATFFSFRAIRNWRIRDFGIAGFFFGLGPYGYPLARFAPLFGWLPLTSGVVSRLKAFVARPREVLGPAVFLLTAFLVALPLLLFFRSNPDLLTSRAKHVGYVLDADEPLPVFWENARTTLLMFHVEGDHNWRHNIDGEPMLLLPMGLLFLLGVFLLVKELVWHLARFRFWEALPLATLLLWLPVMLLPAALTSTELPHALRAAGALPAVVIVSALGVVRPLQLLRGWFHIRPALIIALLLVVSVFLGAQEFDKYFDDWGEDPHLPGYFNQELVDLGRYLRGLDENHDVYVIANGDGLAVDGFPAEAQDIMFLTEGRDITYLHSDDLKSIQPSECRRLIVALIKKDPSILESLGTTFPAMTFQEEPFAIGTLSRSCR